MVGMIVWARSSQDPRLHPGRPAIRRGAVRPPQRPSGDEGTAVVGRA